MRGLPGWAKWTIGILIALEILLAAVFLWLHALLGKIQRVDREDTCFSAT